MHNPMKPAAAVRPTPNSIVFVWAARVFEVYFHTINRRFQVQYLPERNAEQFVTTEDRRNAAELSRAVQNATDLREAAEALGLLK